MIANGNSRRMVWPGVYCRWLRGPATTFIEQRSLLRPRGAPLHPFVRGPLTLNQRVVGSNPYAAHQCSRVSSSASNGGGPGITFDAMYFHRALLIQPNVKTTRRCTRWGRPVPMLSY